MSRLHWKAKPDWPDYLGKRTQITLADGGGDRDGDAGGNCSVSRAGEGEEDWFGHGHGGRDGGGDGDRISDGVGDEGFMFNDIPKV